MDYSGKCILVSVEIAETLFFFFLDTFKDFEKTFYVLRDEIFIGRLSSHIDCTPNIRPGETKGCNKVMQ